MLLVTDNRPHSTLLPGSPDLGRLSCMHFKSPITKASPQKPPHRPASDIFPHIRGLLYTAHLASFCNSPVDLTIPPKPTADIMQDLSGVPRLAITRCTMCIPQLTESSADLSSGLDRQQMWQARTLWSIAKAANPVEGSCGGREALKRLPTRGQHLRRVIYEYSQ